VEKEPTITSEQGYPAPDFIGLENWINSEEIVSLEALRGKVVLIDFWTLGCINCIRTLWHTQELYETYNDQGFEIIGIHAPEFAYERKLSEVQKAVEKYWLTYPVVQDNDFQTWRAYKNRYWPAFYLIDKKGDIRYTHFGEGKYREMEIAVEELLAEQ